jgi:hypothetical protein
LCGARRTGKAPNRFDAWLADYRRKLEQIGLERVGKERVGKERVGKDTEQK